MMNEAGTVAKQGRSNSPAHPGATFPHVGKSWGDFLSWWESADSPGTSVRAVKQLAPYALPVDPLRWTTVKGCGTPVEHCNGRWI